MVSIDGLQPEHDLRRRPATYERILRNIQDSRITVHCTVTGQMTKRSGYLPEFVEFWSAQPQVKRIWISIFTPQRGEVRPEILTVEERLLVVNTLSRLREDFPKLDMSEALLQQFLHPPRDPESCIFARTTTTISADLKTEITPCQFGGNPDCSQCGCMAAMGLAAVSKYRVLPGLTAGALFDSSSLIGESLLKLRKPVNG